MRQASRFLTALASLIVCLLATPVLAAAQQAVFEGTGAGAHIASSQADSSEESQEELAGGEEEAPLAVNAEADEENEEGESEETEQSSVGRHRSPRCVVPALQGESLSGARAALSKAHCKLGKISGLHVRHGSLVVVEQSMSIGKRLAGGSLIAVRLGASGKSRHHR